MRVCLSDNSGLHIPLGCWSLEHPRIKNRQGHDSVNWTKIIIKYMKYDWGCHQNALVCQVVQILGYLGACLHFKSMISCRASEDMKLWSLTGQLRVRNRDLGILLSENYVPTRLERICKWYISSSIWTMLIKFHRTWCTKSESVRTVGSLVWRMAFTF